MTRQRLHQLSRIAKGLCLYCAQPVTPGSKAMCYYHLTKARAYNRKRAGFKPGHESGRGRPAITRIAQPQSDLGNDPK